MSRKNLKKLNMDPVYVDDSSNYPTTSKCKSAPFVPPPPPTPGPKKAGWRVRFVDDVDDDDDDNDNNNDDVKENNNVVQNDPRFNESLFKANETYNGFLMKFLRSDEYVTLKHPVLINHVNYGVEIIQLHKEDEKSLLKIFQRYCPNEQVLPEKLFIRQTRCLIYDKNSNVSRDFQQGLKYNITIHIQGVKCKDNVISPVWRIHSAEMV